MSVTVDYFFNHSGSLAEVAALVNRNIGCSLHPYEGDANDFFCIFLGMELSLQRNKFDNDREMNFEDFGFHLSFRTSVGAAWLRPIQIPTMVSIAYVLCLDLHITGMLVFDGQILLARYEERLDPELNENCVYDVVSEEYVSIPAHLGTLLNRLPDR